MSTMMQLQTAVPWLQGATLVGDGSIDVLRLHTDTRTIERGDLFLALQGEKFDANTMLHDACKAGASALICHAGLGADRYPEGVPRIEVADTRVALAELARGWRAQFSLPLIAVTGSNGKTTVTQMIASILAAAAGDDALATRGNLNNDIGVPLTVLRLRPHHRIAVVELGMNHPGEIAALAHVAQPTVALVNNAQREHLEFMQTVQAVAEENGSVITLLPTDGTAVFPSDDAFTPLWADLAATRRTVRFSLQPGQQTNDVGCLSAHWADGAWAVQARALEQNFAFRLHIAGRHNVKNALAASACALAAGVSVDAVVQGLERFTPVKGRSRAVALHSADRTRTLVDDTYNANPDSVRAAIAVLAELPAPRLLVLGDMGEVGEQGPAFHTETGAEAKASGIEHFFAMGTLARHAVDAFAGAQHFDSIDALNAAVLQQLPQVNSVLVKGSRFMRMERVVEALTQAAGKGQP
ncbi:UDP-N-acetylmuramoyl-tripeptide--D-alanyl-D-alanine ligase [Rhodoferax sp. GW822-FHT02A01]|uniref:UDP-N-acetylmuramoyl-tripeptide--D-alanyl-D- alanine ligase n=1 Tax=Rhodoferax sp. GW822-FHT02A01 TaxID=3141537 RepID=UPI00315DBC67